MATRYWNDLDKRLSELPDVRRKVGKTRVSYWRPDGTRFCKIEEHGGNTTLVLNELDYYKLRPTITNSEPDQDNRVRIRILSKSMLELAIEFARTAYLKANSVQLTPSGD